MLVLSRKPGEKIVIGGKILISVTKVEGDRVYLGIEAPSDVPVDREEIYWEKIREGGSKNSGRRFR